jgi:PEP-CTERM motif-containing protein
MKRLLAGVAIAALIGLAASTANAAVILTFGQTGGADTITGTVNGTATATTITGTNVPVNITEILGGVPVSAFLDLSATSVGAATTAAGFTTQAFDGTFSITSATGGGGTNFLSGSFDDAVFGSGSSLTLSASNGSPGESVTFTSMAIPAKDLGDPRAVSLSFSDVHPAVGIDGTTLAAFTSSVSGDFSANVPEPASLALLGVGVLGIGFVGRRRSR